MPIKINELILSFYLYPYQGDMAHPKSDTSPPPDEISFRAGYFIDLDPLQPPL